MGRTVVGFSSVDGLKKVAGAALGAVQPGSTRLARGEPPVSDDNSVIGVYNGEASADCPAFGIMLLNGAYETSIGWYVDQGKRPDIYGCVPGSFLVANQAGVDHATGGGAQSGVGGIYIVAYDSADGTPSPGDLWGCRSGTFLAKKNTFGLRVIKAFDTTNHWMQARAFMPQLILGKANADIASDESGTVAIYYQSSAGAYADSSIDTGSNTAYNSLDQTVKSGSLIWMFPDHFWSSGTFTENWTIIQSDFSC